MKPGVSFVVPIYNKADWLAAVLDRIKLQRGDFEKQYVFIDDGSTDSSLSIVRDATRDWPNTIIESQANAGSAVATNRGIALADRAYVKFVDADDLLHADATERLLSILAPDQKACLAFGGVATFKDMAALDLDGPLPSGKVRRMKRPLKEAIYRSLFNPTQFLARTDALRAVGGCDERVVFSQEYALTMRLARRWDFLEIPEVVAFLPETVGDRLSHNQGRQLQRVTRAVQFFLEDFPDTPWWLRQQLARRLSGRAWKYVKRSEGALWITNPHFWRQVESFLPRRDHAAFIRRCCDSFETADPRVAEKHRNQEASS